MKFLIIAAGQGSRLSQIGDSKPLIPLLGLPLIERTILTAQKCGFSEFCIVTGYNGPKVRDFLDKLAPRRNVKIKHVINEEWEKSNAVSVLKAKHAVGKENFLLVMADHLLDKEILQHLKSQPIKNNKVILAADFTTDLNPLIDIEDVTKVLVKKNRIVDIGKNIPDYNAYDTGAFLCSTAIFPAIEKSITNNDSSLSGAIKVLAQEKQASVFDIQGRFWLDIDDEAAMKKAQQQLIKQLTKTSDGPVSKYLNRPISTIITKFLLKTNITPNQISFFSFLMAMVGAGLLFFGNTTCLIISGVLVQIASIVDGCDGEIARLKYQESDFGAWFDACLDRYADAFIFFGLSYYAFVTGAGTWGWVIGFLAMIGSFMNSYTADKYDGLMKSKFSTRKTFRIGRDIRMFIVFIGAITNQVMFTLGFLALLTNIENIRRLCICSPSGNHKIS
ncbi:MAG: NTP transferase domain-containing protein [Candidatus Omnitrophica bacterium]|nr:NTP transferase domain-containing protein [Candidatus Omnitrophota bacterium]